MLTADTKPKQVLLSSASDSAELPQSCCGHAALGDDDDDDDDEDVDSKVTGGELGWTETCFSTLSCFTSTQTELFLAHELSERLSVESCFHYTGLLTVCREFWEL